MAGAARGARGLHGGPCARNRCGAWGCGNCTDYSVLFKIFKNQKIYLVPPPAAQKNHPPGHRRKTFLEKSVRSVRGSGASADAAGVPVQKLPPVAFSGRAMTIPLDHPGALRGGLTWPALGASPQLTAANTATHPPPGCPISPRYRPQTQGIFLMCTYPLSNRMPRWLCPSTLLARKPMAITINQRNRSMRCQ